MKRFIVCFIYIIMIALFFQQIAFAEPKADLSSANEIIVQAIDNVESTDINASKRLFDQFSKQWAMFEDDIKKQSKKTYGDIEEKMGMVQFLLNQNPIQKDQLKKALEDLYNTNQLFLEGAGIGDHSTSPKSNQSVSDLLLKLQKAKKQEITFE